jgi:hypothetical protein
MRAYSVVRSRRVHCIATALLAGLGAACVDGSPVEVPVDAAPGDPSLVTLPEESGNGRPGERMFREIAERVPSFAGFHLDESGRLIVRVTDRGAEGAARAAVAPLLPDLGFGQGVGPVGPAVVVEPADYSFRELAAWRDAVESAVFPLDGLVFVDLDERANRVTIGLSDEPARGRVEEALGALPVPRAAVAIRIVGEARPLAGPAGATSASSVGCTTLTGYCRPFVGGYRVTIMKGGAEAICTGGLTALWNNDTPVFITAAHCSTYEWKTDYDRVYQNRYPTELGVEVHDPRGWSCEITFKCRYSDALLARPGDAIEVGYVARTTADGTRDVDQARPRLAINGVYASMTGQRVYALGQTSGRIRGVVTQTCVSFKKTYDLVWHKVVCTDVGDYNAAGGDSGGPVFVWDGSGDQIGLLGITFARNAFYDHTFFSPIGGIRKDLGTLEFRAPEYRGSGGGGGGGCDSDTDGDGRIIAC